MLQRTDMSTIITDFKEPGIRCLPPTDNFHNFNLPGARRKTPGDFVGPVTSIAFNMYYHHSNPKSESNGIILIVLI